MAENKVKKDTKRVLQEEELTKAIKELHKLGITTLNPVLFGALKTSCLCMENELRRQGKILELYETIEELAQSDGTLTQKELSEYLLNFMKEIGLAPKGEEQGPIPL